jgi:hypothetical protein
MALQVDCDEKTRKTRNCGFHGFLKNPWTLSSGKKKTRKNP